MVVLITLVCFLLRIYGIHWDQGAYLHPDERFLAMTILRLGAPHSILEYLNPFTSPLVPFARGMTFFVYGSLPTTTVFWISKILHITSIESVIILGRALSALLDTGIGICLYFSTKLITKRYSYSKYLPVGAFGVYSVTVFAIQQSHFFTVDPWMVFGILLGIYCFVRQMSSRTAHWMIVGSIACGFAISSKVSGVFFLPILLIPYLYKKISWKAALRGMLSLGIVIGTVRIASPSYFHPRFLSSLAELHALTAYGTTFPPSLQWYSKVVIASPLLDIFLWGVGIVFAILCLLAFLVTVVTRGSHVQGREVRLLLALVPCFFIFQSVQFVAPMRYFYPVYPLMAIIIAATGISLWRFLTLPLRILFLIACAIWPLAFLQVYSRPNTRIQASQWMYKNIPPNTSILVEHWDDPLPVAQYNTPNRNYRIRQLEIYAPEKTAQEQELKKRKIQRSLDTNDYIVISSSRGYGSLLPLAREYPVMAQYYADLFSGRSGFERVVAFETRPQICVMLGGRHCFVFQDVYADESFTVYDHPKVEIFKKGVRHTR